MNSIHFEKAKSFESEGNFPEALQEYEIAVKEAPKSIRIMQAFGKLCLGMGDLSKASKIYHELIEFNPSDENYYHLGESYSLSKNFREALYYLKKSLEMNDRYLNSHLLLASIYDKMGNLYKKETYLKNALEVDGKSLVILWELIQLYQKTFRYKESYKYLEKLEQYYPNESVRTGVLKTELLLRMGKFASAKELILDVMENDEKVRKMINLVLSSPERRKEIDEKLKIKKEIFKENEKNQNRDPSLSMEISILYLSVGNFDSAAKFLVYSRKTLEENKALSNSQTEKLNSPNQQLGFFG